ncbi:MAG TPA: hypothetical protein VFT87_01075 [Candidatus Saccharimonadales bacterium]|nr:hypothetical protein [Candidatus Saccharimonadales bacterium]
MKTKMQMSSIEAYAKLRHIGRKERTVLGVILQNGPVSNQEIADTLGWPVNRVTGRTFGLRHKGLVEEAYREAYKTGVRVIHWQAVVLNKLLGCSYGGLTT